MNRCCKVYALPFDALQRVLATETHVRNLPSDARLLRIVDVPWPQRAGGLLYQSASFPRVPENEPWPVVTPVLVAPVEA